MLTTHNHIIYPRTLDGYAAAAVARLLCERDGSGGSVDMYPVDLAPRGPQASIIDRLNDRVHPRAHNGQGRLDIDAHDRTKHHIFLLALALPADEIKELHVWGMMTYCNHVDPLPEYDIITSCLTVERGQATCEATWRGLFSREPMPLAVQLIGRAVIVTSADKGIDMALLADEVTPFVYAMRSVPCDPGDGDDKHGGWGEWCKMFKELANSHPKKRIKEGRAIIRYLVAAGEEFTAPPLQIYARSPERRVEKLFDALAADTARVAAQIGEGCVMKFRTSTGEPVEIVGTGKGGVM